MEQLGGGLLAGVVGTATEHPALHNMCRCPDHSKGGPLLLQHGVELFSNAFSFLQAF